MTTNVNDCKDDEDCEGDWEEEQEDRGDDLSQRTGADVLE